ncbi:MAG: phosphotransferase [Alphaproteobacteria bacterium]|nr:phosphotransferase [Alphaproteobacteria bacterium]
MYEARLNFKGDLAPVIRRACAAYGVGEMMKFKLIEAGYEDYNLKVSTMGGGKYVLKIFASFRSAIDIERYIAVLNKVIESDIASPTLYHTEDGIMFSDSGLSMVMMDFVDGMTFYQLGAAPTNKVLEFICEQTAKINRIKLGKKYPEIDFNYYDVRNMHKTFEEALSFLSPEDRALATLAMEEFDTVPVEALPTCFCHRDIIKTNVMRGRDGKIFLIDFSAGNIYPRIYDLAVIIYHLCFDGRTSMQKISKVVAEMYQKYGTLEPIELEYLAKFALGCACMEMVGSIRWKHLSSQNNSENEDYIELGRTALKLYFEDEQ